MARFNHAFELAFSLETDREDASDVTPEMLREALLERIRTLDANNELAEACGAPWDTYEA
jgi:hypothetical protein